MGLSRIFGLLQIDTTEGAAGLPIILTIIIFIQLYMITGEIRREQRSYTKTFPIK